MHVPVASDNSFAALTPEEYEEDTETTFLAPTVHAMGKKRERMPRTANRRNWRKMTLTDTEDMWGEKQAMKGTKRDEHSKAAEEEAQERNKWRREEVEDVELLELNMLEEDVCDMNYGDAVEHLNEPGRWVSFAAVMDSGAADHVSSSHCAPDVPVLPSAGSRRGQHYVAANGERIPNQGEQHLQLVTASGAPAQMTFQTADVKQSSGVWPRGWHHLQPQHGADYTIQARGWHLHARHVA